MIHFVGMFRSVRSIPTNADPKVAFEIRPKIGVLGFALVKPNRMNNAAGTEPPVGLSGDASDAPPPPTGRDHGRSFATTKSYQEPESCRLTPPETLLLARATST